MNAPETVEYLDSDIFLVETPPPRQEFPTFADLASEDPDHDYIYVVEDTNEWYYWSGSNWVSGGDYFPRFYSAEVNALANRLHKDEHYNQGQGLYARNKMASHLFLNGTEGQLYDNIKNLMDASYGEYTLDDRLFIGIMLIDAPVDDPLSVIFWTHVTCDEDTAYLYNEDGYVEAEIERVSTDPLVTVLVSPYGRILGTENWTV